MSILTDTVDGLFEITVNNRRFTGKEVKNLPLIDQITIVQIYHNGHIILPHGDTQIHLGDHIVLLDQKILFRKCDVLTKFITKKISRFILTNLLIFYINSYDNLV